MEIYQPALHFDRDKRVVAYLKDRLLHGEPCAAIGMHGNGIEYPFAVLVKEITKLKTPYTVTILETTSEDELRAFLKTAKKSSQPLLCLIKLRIGKDVSWFINELDAIRTKKEFLFVPCVVAYIGDVYTALLEVKKILTKSLFILSPITWNEAIQMIKELSARFDFYPTDIQAKEVYCWSYGHVALIKSLFLLKKEFPRHQFTNQFLLSQPTILSRLVSIIDDLPKELINCIHEQNGTVLQKFYIEKFGLGRNSKLFHPLLEELFQINAMPVDILFSPVELRVYKFLKNNESKLSTREQVAQVMWGKSSWEEKYSEWAIGQLMYRIRKKLKKASEHTDIQTKKGEGFILLQK